MFIERRELLHEARKLRLPVDTQLHENGFEIGAGGLVGDAGVLGGPFETLAFGDPDGEFGFLFRELIEAAEDVAQRAGIRFRVGNQDCGCDMRGGQPERRRWHRRDNQPKGACTRRTGDEHHPATRRRIVFVAPAPPDGAIEKAVELRLLGGAAGAARPLTVEEQAVASGEDLLCDAVSVDQKPVASDEYDAPF